MVHSEEEFEQGPVRWVFNRRLKLEFTNTKRFHSTLGEQTPAEAYGLASLWIW